MPPTPSDTNPSRQVERIREILVGRQMEGVERRLERLEANLRPLPTEAGGDVFEIRLATFEKRQDEKFAALRDEIDAEKARRVEETHRLAAQIQAAARSRADSGLEAQVELEQRFTRWLDHWNQGFRSYLHQREEHLVTELKAELDKTREWVKSTVETDRGRVNQTCLQESFTQLADAARAIAEAASLQAGNAGGAR